MAILNFEFKARTADIKKMEERLLLLKPKFIGEDLQRDTYFNVVAGRLKLREGNIENALIWYERPDSAGAKRSDVLLYQHPPDKNLKDILKRVHGVKVIVDKKRRIYFVDNVKFHFDTVTNLGTFIEVEAIDSSGNVGIEELKQQCAVYAKLFNVHRQDYIRVSYSDMVLEFNNVLHAKRTGSTRTK
jgi:adenylate cyclase class 2